MEGVKRIVQIRQGTEVSEEAHKLFADFGFRELKGKFMTYSIQLTELFKLQDKLYDEDYHLDQVWEEKYELRQGYRCPQCNGLDLEPNLKCVKEL